MTLLEMRGITAPHFCTRRATYQDAKDRGRTRPPPRTPPAAGGLPHLTFLFERRRFSQPAFFQISTRANPGATLRPWAISSRRLDEDSYERDQQWGMWTWSSNYRDPARGASSPIYRKRPHFSKRTCRGPTGKPTAIDASRRMFIFSRQFFVVFDGALHSVFRRFPSKDTKGTSLSGPPSLPHHKFDLSNAASARADPTTHSQPANN